MDFALPLAPTFVKAWRNLLKRGVLGPLGGRGVGRHAGGRGCNVIMAYMMKIVANHAIPILLLTPGHVKQFQCSFHTKTYGYQGIDNLVRKSIFSCAEWWNLKCRRKVRLIDVSVWSDTLLRHQVIFMHDLGDVNKMNVRWRYECSFSNFLESTVIW